MIKMIPTQSPVPAKLQASQQAFTDYIQDPSKPLPNNTDQRAMQVYRRLLFNNMQGFISNGFPVLKSLYTEQHWRQLIECFFQNHACQSPIFADIALEFVQFLQHYSLKDNDPPFLLELAHYEVLELSIGIAKEDPNLGLFELNQLETQPLLMMKQATIACYQYPVHQISAEFQPPALNATEQANQPSYAFCVYRDPQDEVQFMLLNGLTAQVLAVIEQQTDAGGIGFSTLLELLVEHYPQLDPEVLNNGLRQLITEFAQRGVLAKLLS